MEKYFASRSLKNGSETGIGFRVDGGGTGDERVWRVVGEISQTKLVLDVLNFGSSGTFRRIFPKVE